MFSLLNPSYSTTPDKASSQTAPSVLLFEPSAALVMDPIKYELLTLAFQGLHHMAPPPFPASFHTSPLQAPTWLFIAHPKWSVHMDWCLLLMLLPRLVSPPTQFSL